MNLKNFSSNHEHAPLKANTSNYSVYKAVKFYTTYSTDNKNNEEFKTN